MPDHISPLDERFIKLGRAAVLIAKENPTTSPASVLDQFSRAIFVGEFDPPPVSLFDDEALKKRNAPENWLHILIETPAVWLSPEQRMLSPRPVEYFGANRSTVTSVMHSMDALPGHGDQWSSLLEDLTMTSGKEEAYTALSKTPLDHFPLSGRRFLAGAYAPKQKLRAWFEDHGLPLPAFLQTPTAARPGQAGSVFNHQRTEGNKGQGRPKKSSWPRIAEILMRLREEHPRMQKKELAYEARRIAAKSIDDGDLPSVATIQRRMHDIFSNCGNSLH